MMTFTIAQTAVKEKIRRFSYLAMVGIALAAAFLFVPTTNLSGIRTMTIQPDVYAQATNATWVPMTSAMAMAFFFPLIGFSYIRGLINVDRETGTMDMLLASGVGRFRYVFGKLMAGFFLLASLISIVMIGSFITMKIQFHGAGVPVWSFVSPFLALLPSLLFITALALVLETASFFRNGNMKALSTLIFFVLFIFSVINSMRDVRSGQLNWDFTGTGVLFQCIQLASLKATGKSVMGFSLFSNISIEQGKAHLTFPGIQLNRGIITTLVLITAGALVLTVFASLMLEKRPAEIRQKPLRGDMKKSAGLQRVSGTWQAVPAGRFSFISLAKAELRRLLADLELWWFIAAGILWLAGWVTPAGMTRGILLPLIFGLAMLPLSHLGSEEHHSGMGDWLRTIPGAPLRQARASGGTALSLCVFLALPACIKSLSFGVISFLAVLSWAMCIPAVAFFLGNWTKTERPFQMLLLLFLYLTMNSPDTILPVAKAPASIAGMCGFIVTAGAFLAVFLQREKLMR